MAGMSALVLRIVFSCSFPFFPSFLLFCVCLPLSHFFHSHYFCSKQRTQSCSHPLMGPVYTWGQASKPDSCWSQILHPSLALFIASGLNTVLCLPFLSHVFPCLALLLEGSSVSLLAHLAGASLGACWRLWYRAPFGHRDGHSSTLWHILSISTTWFSGKGTVCYSSSLPTAAQHSSPVVQGTICFFNILSHCLMPSCVSELALPSCPSFLLSLLFF